MGLCNYGVAGLLPALSFLLVIVLQAVAASAINCTVEPNHKLCCQTEAHEPCLFSDVVKVEDGCPIACKKRYSDLGYNCFATHSTHFRWQQMAKNCDPGGIVRFAPPRSRNTPGYAGQRATVGSAVQRHGGHALVFSRASMTAVALLLMGTKKTRLSLSPSFQISLTLSW